MTRAELDQVNPDGATDTTLILSPPGSNDQFNGVQIDDQGRLVLNGVASDGSMFLARYSSTGTPDATFGSGGKITLNTSDAVVQAAIAADGTVFTIGENGGSALAGHFDSGGNVIGAFGGGGSVTMSQLAPQDAQGVRSEGIAIQGDGKIVIVGQTPDKNFGIVRLNSDGSLDTGFGNNGFVVADFGGNDGADRVSVDATTGNIAVFGATDANGGQIAVAIYDSNGLPLPDFGTNGLQLFSIPSTARLWDSSGLGIVVGSGSVRGNNAIVGTGKKHTTSTTTTTNASALQRIVLGSAAGVTSLGSFGQTGKKNVPLTFTLNGVKTTLTIQGGSGTASQDGNNIDLTITSASGALVIKNSGGRASLGNVTVTGGLKSITATTSDLVGTFNVSGALAKATFGAISGVLRAGGAIGSLTTTSLSGTVSSGAGIGKVKLGAFTGTLAAATSIASVSAASMTNAKLLAGANLGANGILGGGDDTFGAGSINTFSVTGAMSGSIVAAGVDPVD
ncbi:MAG TPA: hypothetical protein VKT80_17215, partial [Chloroflexota bacterium]|nr:hypothetical protein [Chloroflexota bacterium]